jgi:GNAT superfamily N-acetyltransferase
MELYRKYLQERESKNIIYDDKSFIVYEINPPYVFLKEIYVIPEERKKGITDQLEQKLISLAKEDGCEIIVTSLSFKDNNWQRSKRVIRLRNYKLLRIDKPTRMAYFWKEI